MNRQDIAEAEKKFDELLTDSEALREKLIKARDAYLQRAREVEAKIALLPSRKGTVSVAAMPTRAGSIPERVLEAIRTAGSPIGTREIITKLGGGVAPRLVYAALYRFTKTGVLTAEGERRSMRYGLKTEKGGG